MKVLEFKNVSMNFCNELNIINVIDDITFDLKEGEILAITGPSGAGKSTILNLISELIKPSKGEININGNVGYMFQHDHLFEWQTIYKNILLGLEIQKKKTKENLLKVERLLKTYNLWEFKDSYPKELSGGMRQRVALIRTLVVDPMILLLDEPFASLDYQTKLKVSEDIYSIIKKEKKTTIMVTHDISEAISMADKVMVLTSRPAKIKNIYNIVIDATSPLKKRQVKEFQNYFEKIWDALNNE